MDSKWTKYNISAASTGERRGGERTGMAVLDTTTGGRRTQNSHTHTHTVECVCVWRGGVGGFGSYLRVRHSDPSSAAHLLALMVTHSTMLPSASSLFRLLPPLRMDSLGTAAPLPLCLCLLIRPIHLPLQRPPPLSHATCRISCFFQVACKLL